MFIGNQRRAEEGTGQGQEKEHWREESIAKKEAKRSSRLNGNICTQVGALILAQFFPFFSY